MNSVLKSLSKIDPILNQLSKDVAPISWVSSQNVFNDLLSCIIEQQIPYRSTKKTFEKMLDKSGLDAVTPETFEIFEEKGIQDYKLSRNKIESIASLLEFYENGAPTWEKL